MRAFSILSLSLAPLILSGCVTKVITAPFRAAGTVVETAVDATTQSQSEKEEDLGRKVLADRKKQGRLSQSVLASSGGAYLPSTGRIASISAISSSNNCTRFFQR